MVKVETPNPESIYLFVASNLAFSKTHPPDEKLPFEKQVESVVLDLISGKNTKITEPLSRTPLDGAVFQREETNITFNQIGEGGPTFAFETTILIADQARRNPPYGYYSAQRFENVINCLDKGAYKTWDINKFPSTAIWFYDTDGTRILTRLGPRNLQERRGRWMSVPFYVENPILREQEQNRVNEEIARDPSNGIIEMYLFYLRTDATEYIPPSDERRVTFKDKDRFFKDLAFYTDVYQRLMNALYCEARTDPDITITLKPPYDVRARLIL